MTDIELPDTRHSDLGIDLEKGIFLRRQRGDTTDSGNNSLNTNKSNSSTGTSSSSKQSQPIESSFMEEDEDQYAENLKMSPQIRITKPQINKNIIEVRYRGKYCSSYFTPYHWVCIVHSLSIIMNLSLFLVIRNVNPSPTITPMNISYIQGGDRVKAIMVCCYQHFIR